MYVVISYDFGGTGDVRIHAVTKSLAKAKVVYTFCEAQSAGCDPEYKLLVEIVEIESDDFASKLGVPFFWERIWKPKTPCEEDAPDYEEIMSNNSFVIE